MSFTLRVGDIVDLGDRTWLRAQLAEGAYYGPQDIRLTSTTGERRTTAILRHTLTGLLGWPIMPDHHVRLDLYIATLRPPFSIDTSRLVEGVGSAPPLDDSKQFLWLSQDGGMPDREFDDRFRDWQRRAEDLDRKIRQRAPGKYRGEILPLLVEIIERFETLNDLQRQLIINCLNNNFDALMETVAFSGTPQTEDGFRKRMLLFVIRDQGRDPRDAILGLAHQREVGERLGLDVDRIFKELAPLASDFSKWGWSSTRRLLLRG